MVIKEAKFLMSNTDWQKCPKPVLPEYAFIGRSNVGKSSTIRVLTGKKGRLGKRPGSTRRVQMSDLDLEPLLDILGFGFMSRQSMTTFDEIKNNNI